jgi:hypothetical protein
MGLGHVYKQRVKVFKEGSERDGMDSFSFIGSSQSSGLESSHGSRSDSEDRDTPGWWKYLPR